jgi:hypothetical protein
MVHACIDIIVFESIVLYCRSTQFEDTIRGHNLRKLSFSSIPI